METREYLIRRFIRPSFGASELGSLTTEDITRWENSIPARTGVSRRVARDARAVLCTMLGDAAAAKPPLIPYNPAIGPATADGGPAASSTAARSGCGPLPRDATPEDTAAHDPQTAELARHKLGQTHR